MRALRPLALIFVVLELAPPLFGGGPLVVGGDFGPSGKPFTWDNSKPIQYRVDGGSLGKLTQVNAVTRVNSAFAAWSSVPTAKLTFTNLGAILSTGAFTDGDVSTVNELDAVMESCTNSSSPQFQTPIILDSDGSLLQQLGADPYVLGFDSPCVLTSDGHYISSLVLLNGAAYSGSTNDLTSDELDAVIEHEVGHLLGLDHSQVNINLITENPPPVLADLSGLPTMFPFIGDGAQKSLSEDDMAWISYLYPVPAGTPGKTPFNSVYGIIAGTVHFADGITAEQGVNVVARQLVGGTGSRSQAYSCVSGYLFTGNPGQTVTGTNPGSYFGSRDPLLIGYYEIPVLAGSYSITLEPIYSEFVGGSSVGPVGQDFPLGRGTQPNVSGSTLSGPFTVAAGAVSQGNDVSTVETPLPRFDSFESQ